MRLRDLLRPVRGGRRTTRTGIFVGVVGPDGSGKTTLARAIEARCAYDGRPFGYVHWRPSPLRPPRAVADEGRSEEHTSELQSRFDLVCRLLLEKKKSYIT